jgi:hypothetical protein
MRMGCGLHTNACFLCCPLHRIHALMPGACPLASPFRTGLALADGGMVGVITASNNGTLTLWPEAELRSGAQEKGLALQSEHLLREQWPLHCFSSAGKSRLCLSRWPLWAALAAPGAAAVAAGSMAALTRCFAAVRGLALAPVG